jgi:hypothetical protein
MNTMGTQKATGIDTDPGADAPPGRPAGSPRQQVMAMISGYWPSQICGTVAPLGMADHLAHGPVTIAELAALTSAAELKNDPAGGSVRDMDVHPDEGAAFAQAMGSLSAEASAAVLAIIEAVRRRAGAGPS